MKLLKLPLLLLTLSILVSACTVKRNTSQKNIFILPNNIAKINKISKGIFRA